MLNVSSQIAPKDVVEPHAGTALVVEDQPLIRRAWIEWLRSDGWQTAEADSVDEALKVATAAPPVVAICDVSLGPGRSGVWLANQLLALDIAPQIVYATSHGVMPGNETLRAGVSGYLLKPFGRLALVSAVNAAEGEFLGRRRRAGAEQALRSEVASLRKHLYARIDRLEKWERLNSSAIVARLYPSGRSDREALATALAERAGAAMGMTGPERLTLMQAVELRDLGKLTMPSRLLESERPLATIERQILATYVFESQMAIARCGWDAAAAWVGEMAAPWDGLTPATTGHGPQSYGPSLTRVINVYLAMVEDRPYRPAFSSLDAIEHLRRGAGHLYCPQSVDALVGALGRKPL